ncbi:hypothetical protein [Cyclobacterium xiamenense]|nr:hypothetical protein [Cyclobacterium xiamenense]
MGQIPMLAVAIKISHRRIKAKVPGEGQQVDGIGTYQPILNSLAGKPGL